MTFKIHKSFPLRDCVGRSHLHRFRRQRLEAFTMAGNVSRAGRSADTHDAYRDMRLDIDNMTYEELLALEERMGKVSTGVTEENISKCLSLKMCGKHSKKNSCVICLDDYKIEKEVGVLKKCGHEYHSSCIIMWLASKKTCPICRIDVIDLAKSD